MSSAQAGVIDHDLSTAHLCHLSVHKMVEEEPPPIDWIVEPVVARGEVTMIAGREGRGKSMFSQMLGVAMASPEVAHLPDDFVVKQGTALFIDAENGRATIHRRIRAAGLDAPDRYHVCEARALDLRSPDHLAEVYSVVRGCGADVVVLDSLATLAPGIRENEAEAMAPFMAGLVQMARELEVGVILLHHASKADTGEYRGSTAIGAGVALVLVLRAHPDDDQANRRELMFVKVRIDAEPESAWLAIVNDDGRLRIEEVAPREPVAAPASAVVQMAARVEEALHRRGTLAVAELAAEVGATKDSGTFKRARRSLVDSGRASIPQWGFLGPPAVEGRGQQPPMEAERPMAGHGPAPDPDGRPGQAPIEDRPGRPVDHRGVSHE